VLGRGERLRLSAAVAAVALVALAAAAAAVAGHAASKDTTAALTGSSQWTSGYAISGSFGGSLGRGTYSGTLTAGASVTTPTCGPVCAAVAGGITFSTRTGDFTASVQPGGIVSMEDIASHSFRNFRVQLIIVGGTRHYAHLRGRLSLSYESVWTHEWVDGVFVDDIADTGTLTGTIRSSAR
jgi:hypothetical protein